MNRKQFSDILVIARKNSSTSINEVVRQSAKGFQQIQRIELASSNYSMDNVYLYLQAIGYTIVITSNKESFQINNRISFTNTFTYIRKEMKYTQDEAAKKIGVNITVITGIESRGTNTSIDKFLQCVYGLDCLLQIKSIQ